MPPFDPLDLKNQSEPLKERLGTVAELLEVGLELGGELTSGLCELFLLF